MKRISILTASFGEGHNTAARNIHEALQVVGGDNQISEVCDLYQRTNPGMNRGMQIGYSVAINRFPRIWKTVFGVFGMRGVMELMLPTLGALREAMRQHFLEFRPDLIVSTYPVFSFLLQQIRRTSPFLRAPLATMITDSTEINPVWFRSRSEAFLVTDDGTADLLRRDGVDPATIHVLGFPVDLRFEKVAPLRPEQVGPPWKLIFFPSTRKGHTLACLDRLLRLPGLEITVITGKHREVYAALARAGYDRAPHVKLVGWTDQMPELLSQHHLFLGKAGGAIVQECLAAKIPFVVSHLVPGQEEGNMQLIEELGVGMAAQKTPDGLAAAVSSALADGGATWRGWKENLDRISRPDASRQIAEFLLRWEVPR